LAIVDKLKPTLLGEQTARLAQRQTVDLEVYNSYLIGLFFWHRRGEMNLKKAIDHFEQAIEKAPDYAPAYAGLASSYSLLPFYSSLLAKETVPKAREMALEALRIDKNLAEAHAILGYIKSWFDWDWEGAESEFRRAIELNPGYGSAHHWYSYTLMYQARFNEAIREIEQALELDPASVAINKDVGTVYVYAGQFDRAIEACKRTIEMDAAIMYIHLHIGMAYVGKSMYEEALIEFQKEREISKGAHAWTELCIGCTYVEMGKPEEAVKVLDDLVKRSEQEYVSPFILASFYLVLGKNDEGFKLLSKAHEQQDEWLCFLRIHPSLSDSIRSDPRYTALLKKMNLDK
jgi:tetratricopeptide (TPR) repeat protein